MTSILDAVFAVFASVIEWFITSIEAVTALFYTASGGLTLIGTMSVVSLGIAVILLLCNVVKDYLRFR